MRGFVLVFGLHAGDHWFGADKVKHFFMSAFVESVTYSALRGANVRHDPALIAAPPELAGDRWTPTCNWNEFGHGVHHCRSSQ